MSGTRINLQIDSRLESVAVMGRSIRAIVAGEGIEDSEAFQIELASVELLTNAIRHALSLTEDSWVSMELRIEEEMLHITMRDPGTEMDASLLDKAEAPAVDVGADIAAFPEGGMGLFLIKEVMQQVEYAREGDINVWRLSRPLVKPLEV